MNTYPSYPFQNIKLSLEERVSDLVSRLTLEEKLSLIPFRQASVKRLGIPGYWIGGTAVQGLVAYEGATTVFPQNLGLSCAWNTELIKEIGEMIGDEARAYDKLRNGLRGLMLRAPVVDLARDPRWGRTDETFGEDPFLTGCMYSAYSKGMRGDHPFYIKAAPILNYFYAGNNEKDRLKSSSCICPRNKREYYLKAFETPVREGSVHSVMTAYNAINGTPAICHPDIKAVLKDEWKLDGFVVSAFSDMQQTVDEHQYCNTYAEAAAAAIKAGIDCIMDDSELVKKSIREALEQGLLSETDIDRAIRNVFRVRMRLGQFDPEAINPYAQITESVLYKQEHRELALKAARESVVLLKNENNMLPLDKERLQSAAVIGPLGDVVCRGFYTGSPPYQVTPLQGIMSKLDPNIVQFKDGCDRIILQSAATRRFVGQRHIYDATLAANKEDAGSGEHFKLTDWGLGSLTLLFTANSSYVTCGASGISASAKEVWGWFNKELFNFIPQDDGTVAIKAWNGQIATVVDETIQLKDDAQIDISEKFIIHPVIDGIAEAVAAARASDVAIVVVGNHPLINGREVVDRQDLSLPPQQEKLIQEVHKANPNTVVVIIGSYPFALNWAQENIPAIVYTAHGGQELGNAVADVLFGDYNPAGRLSMTWYRSVLDLPDMLDYDIIKGKRTYLYFDGDPLYPFGHGLSYTGFQFSDLKLSKLKMTADDQVKVKVTVKNTGLRPGDEVVQLYIRANKSRVKRPLKELRGFTRIHLQPGEKRTEEFDLAGTDFACWDVTRDGYAVETGPYTIMVGNSSGNIILEAAVHVHGETIPPRYPYRMIRAENYDDYESVFLDECRDGEARQYGFEVTGSCVSVIGRDGWISFHDVEFESGAAGFEARAACATENGSFEMRLDNPDGMLTGICHIGHSGGRQSWGTYSCRLTGAEGRHDVYLRLQGGVHLSSFRFVK